MTSLESKDVSDWLKIVVLLGAGFMAYQRLADRVDVSVRAETQLVQQTTRIERYLSAKDPNYWITSRRMSDPPPAGQDSAQGSAPSE